MVDDSKYIFPGQEDLTEWNNSASIDNLTTKFVIHCSLIYKKVRMRIQMNAYTNV